MTIECGDTVWYVGPPSEIFEYGKPYRVYSIEERHTGDAIKVYEHISSGYWGINRFKKEEKNSRWHFHHDLIIAWAKGAEIQFKTARGKWVDLQQPTWIPDVEFRIKPEPKPDVVTYASVKGECAHRRPVILSSASTNWSSGEGPAYTNPVNVKFTFDGETGKLKAVELINV